MPFLSFNEYPEVGTSIPATAPIVGTDASTAPASRSLIEGGSNIGEDEVQKRGWIKYAPLGVLLFIIFLPHPSYIITLSSYYLKTRHAPWRFVVHLLAVHVLTLGALASVVACVTRDPGSVGPVGRGWNAKSGPRNNRKDDSRAGRGQKKIILSNEPVADTEDEVTTSLLRGGGESYDGCLHDTEDGYEVQDDDLAPAEEGERDGVSSSRANSDIDVDELTLNGRWCTRCRHARPERAHHCGACGRCVLKMDHHCPWLGGNCVGHRTYPAFVHFLLMATLLSAYITCVALTVVVYLVSNPFDIDPHASPLHALFLLLMGAVFTLTMGSFLIYHVFLMSTNQTTLEHMSPFLLLRYIPPPPPPPPLEGPQACDVPPYTPYGSRQPQIYTHMARPPFVDSGTQASPVTPESLMPLRALHFERNNGNATTATRNSDTILRPFRTTLAYRPPEEHDLSPAQRRVVQHVHGRVQLYDLGWRRNWGQVFGGGRPRSQGEGGGYRSGARREQGPWGDGWCRWCRWIGLLVLWGGRPRGDGRTFERGRRAREGLEKLVRGLEDVRRSEGRGWRWGGE